MRLIKELQQRGYNSAEIGEKLLNVTTKQYQQDARTIRKDVKRDPLIVADGNVMSDTDQVVWTMAQRGGVCRVTAKEMPHFRSAVQNSFQSLAHAIMQLSPP